MNATRKYVTATAFRASLETRLKQIANTEQVDLQRLRRMVAFDRFLARIVQDKQTRFVKFHLDIGVGDAVLEPLESIITRDWLGFAGLRPATVLILSKEQQFSEKLHAYTLPNRSTLNSRVKDLVDMALLIRQGGLDPQRIKASLDVTFMRRKTHSLPETLNPPPDNWKPVFEKLAKSCGVTDDIEKTFTLLEEFMKKI